LQRSCKTEGVVVFARAQAFGAFDRVTLVVVELRDEAVEAFPEREDVCAGVGVGIVWLEAGDLRADACDLAGSEIDQQVQLAVGVEESGGECGSVGGVLCEVFEVVGEQGEADGDDIVQVHLQRLNGAEAPEDRQDDLPERLHGWEYIPARGTVDSGREYPLSWTHRYLKSCGMIFGCPTVLHHLYPPFSLHPQTRPPRRRGSSGWAGCWVLCADALSFGGTGSRPSPGTRERGSRFQRCIFDAPYGVGGGRNTKMTIPASPLKAHANIGVAHDPPLCPS
jgi:hypothetical protein